MTSLLREVQDAFRSSPVFSSYVLVTLAIAGAIALITFDIIDLGMTHFGQRSHRVHDLTFGFLFTTAVVGVLVQLTRSSQNVAGMVMAFIPWVGLLLSGVLSADVDRVVLRNPSSFVIPPTVIVALLHPAGREFFRSFALSRVNSLLIALVIVAAVPLLAFASTNIGLQATVSDEHAGMGHYGFMGAFSFTVVVVGLLASLRPDGWRLAAWVAGLLPLLLGLASVIYPVTSSLSLPWAIGAIAWGIGFVAAAEMVRNAEGPPARSRTGRPGVPGRRQS
jgi:hypothetical protein